MSSGTGTITIEGNVATLTFHRWLPYPPERVWSAITNPEKRAEWFGPTTLEPKKDGFIETTAEGPPAPEEIRRTQGKILVWQPPHVFEYEEASPNVGKTIIRFELEADGSGTKLRFVQSGLNPNDAGGYAPGWHVFLDRLEAFMEGTALPHWGEQYDIVQHEYQT